MPISEFHEKAREEWATKVDALVGSATPSTMQWHGPNSIITALAPFMGANKNHALFPTGGGFDFASVTNSWEPGCIEFGMSARSVKVLKPLSLTLEYIAADPAQSFFILELEKLEPSGVYENLARPSEELVEVNGDYYVERSYWDAGILPDGSPLPDDSRLTVRLLSGRIMLLSKGSIWNGLSETYDGRHDRMTNSAIRSFIEQGVKYLQERATT